MGRGCVWVGVASHLGDGLVGEAATLPQIKATAR